MEVTRVESFWRAGVGDGRSGESQTRERWRWAGWWGRCWGGWWGVSLEEEGGGRHFYRGSFAWDWLVSGAQIFGNVVECQVLEGAPGDGGHHSSSLHWPGGARGRWRWQPRVGSWPRSPGTSVPSIQRESLKVGNVLITGSSGLQERARADCGLWRPVRGPSGSPAPSGPFPLSRSSLLLLAHKLAPRHISQHLLPGVENMLPLVVGNFF